MLRTVVVVLALSGCSFALVSGPPSNHRRLPVVECTTSRVGPVLDTVWTTLQTLNAVLAVSNTDEEWDDLFDGDPPFSRSTAIPTYVGLAVLGAAGMYYGFTRTGACRDAKAEQLERSGQPGGVSPYGPGTWPPPPPPAAAPPPPVPPAPPPAPTTDAPTTDAPPPAPAP